MAAWAMACRRYLLWDELVVTIDVVFATCVNVVLFAE